MKGSTSTTVKLKPQYYQSISIHLFPIIKWSCSVLPKLLKY